MPKERVVVDFGSGGVRIRLGDGRVVREPALLAFNKATSSKVMGSELESILDESKLIY
jgi:hypothetical protein